MKQESAAGVPLVVLLGFVALEGVASRWWAIALVVLSGGAFLAWLIWRNWPREEPPTPRN